TCFIWARLALEQFLAAGDVASHFFFRHHRPARDPRQVGARPANGAGAEEAGRGARLTLRILGAVEEGHAAEHVLVADGVVAVDEVLHPLADEAGGPPHGQPDRGVARLDAEALPSR